MHRCVHKRVHRVLVDVSVSVRKCVCTCSQVDSCTGTFAHVYVSMGVHECAQVCTGAQGAVHVGAHVCKYGCTQKCSRVFACGHTPSAHTCAQVSVHKRAQACTSAPVGVCAHVCACAGPLLARSAAHMCAVSAHTQHAAHAWRAVVQTHACALTPLSLRRTDSPSSAPRGTTRRSRQPCECCGGVGGCAPPPH